MDDKELSNEGEKIVEGVVRRNEKGQLLPGSILNPDGKAPGTKSLTTKVREALEKIAEGKDYTYEEAFIRSILKKAIVDGDSSTQKLVWNYLDGLPKQRMEVDVDKDTLGELTQFFRAMANVKKDDE